MSFDLKNKKVTMIGAARSGAAVAEVVLRLGGIAKISESKSPDQINLGLSALDSRLRGNDRGRDQKENLIIETGGHTKAFIQDSDYVVLSPGVRLDALPVKWARERSIEVMGEVEFAFRLCPCPVVAVTGSNGKTTTSTLIAQIIKRAGRRVCLCGNIGSPFSEYVMDLKPADTVVLEISSFQLESTVHFKPHVAVWTNFSQNHLDRHKDLEEYFQAKCKVFANQGKNDFAVLNFQESWIPAFAGMTSFVELAERLKANVLFFNQSHPRLTSPIKVDGSVVGNPNYLAVMQTAKALGLSEDICLKTFSEFRGVEHRLEFVRNLGGVDFINDSKSTTLEAGRWALERADKPVIMICGGSDKKLDYSPLKPLVSQKVKHMIAIGQIREIMRSTFADVVTVDTFTSFEEAIKAARGIAGRGECVLLSPMTASFDMFDDYEHRGRCFKEIVNKLI